MNRVIPSLLVTTDLLCTLSACVETRKIIVSNVQFDAERSAFVKRDELRVEFRSDANLRAIASKDDAIILHTHFCSHPTDFAMLSGPTVYMNGFPITGALSIDVVDPTYYFHLNLTRQESLRSKPVEIGFDLRTAPEDVCFYITEANETGLHFKSSTATVPKATIESALRSREVDGNQIR